MSEYSPGDVKCIPLPPSDSWMTGEHEKNRDQDLRLECLKEVFRHRSGTIGDMIEQARKAYEFVTTDDRPSRP